MNIGNIAINGRFVLGPMAGVADLPFRMLCKKYGCCYTTTEMISAKSILYGNKNTARLTDHAIDGYGCEGTRALQLFGSDPDVMAEAVRIIDSDESCPFDVVDINMGCPVPKVVKNGEGCALMINPPLAGRIVSAVVKASTHPVSVKMRKGFYDNEPNAVEIALIAEASGASAVTVHGRTRGMMYGGKVDLRIIADVKNALRIPVIGNGDVTSREAAEEMFAQTNCDAVMIARGALGCPHIFAMLEHGVRAPSWDELRMAAHLHMDMAYACKGDAAVREMRKHIAWYIRGMPFAASLRKRVNEAESFDEMKKLIQSSELKPRLICNGAYVIDEWFS